MTGGGGWGGSIRSVGGPTDRGRSTCPVGGPTDRGGLRAWWVVPLTGRSTRSVGGPTDREVYTLGGWTH